MRAQGLAGAPLDGIVVVSIEQAISAPFASRQLADLGATVIKIERPDTGDFARHYDGNVGGQSSFFVWANRAKQSLVLDTKDGPDRKRLHELLATADVYLHNLAPDAARRAELDAAAIRREFPAIIACEISGYGEGGPRSSDKAYDLAIQAEAGVFDVTGDDSSPSKVGLSIADIAAAMYAFSGILAALVRRERTGVGATVSVSMLDALAEWMSAPLLNAHAIGRTPKRTARRHAAIAPYGTFVLKDGSTLLVALQNQAEWKRFCASVLENAAIADETRFSSASTFAIRDSLVEDVIQSVFRSTNAEEVRTRIIRADIASAHVNTLADVWEHEQLRARERFMPTQLPGGQTIETLVPPIGIDGCPPPRAVIPALNENQLGYV